MEKPFNLCCFFVLLLCFSLHVQSRQLDVPVQVDGIQISHILEFYKESNDASGLTIDDAIALNNMEWLQLGHNPSFKGNLESRYWFRVKLNFDQAFSGYIEMDRPMVDDVKVYLIVMDDSVDNQYDVIAQYQVGDAYAHSKRPVDSYNMVIPIQSEADASVYVYFKLSSIYTPIQEFEAKIWEENAYNSHAKTSAFLLGLYFGTLVLIFLYNLLIFISTGEKSYFYYVAYIFSMGMAVFTVYGLSYQYLWPNSPEWNSRSVELLAPLGRIFAILFSVTFLDIKKHLPLAYKALFFFVIYDLVILLSYPFGIYAKLYVLFALPSLIVFPLLLCTGIALWTRGVKEARFFAGAWFIYSVAWVGYSYTLMGGLSYDPVRLRVVLGAQLIEAMLLAIALADKVSLAKEKAEELNVLSKQAKEDAEKLLSTRTELMEVQMESIEMEHKAKTAEVANKAKSEFLATMSHEIRTPMNGVLGMAELLSETKLTEAQQRYLSVIQDSGQDLLAVINDILDYSKIEADKMHIELIDVDLESLIDSCTEVFALQCVNKDVQLISSFAVGTPLKIRTDATRLRQILINLVSNAIKFTDEGEVTIKISHIDGTISFEICDTGIGMSEQQQETLFEAFHQADNSITRRYGGTGLGLSICKRLLDLMGGHISVQSKLDLGTSFVFSLPYLEASQDFEIDTPYYKQELLNKRLLIVDDDKVFCDMTRQSCMSWGLDVVIRHDAESGMDAIKEAELSKQPFDLVLVDIILPKIDGYRMMQSIKDDLAVINKPNIVLVSAIKLADKEQEIGEFTHIPYLEKPVTSGLLRETLAVALGSQSRLMGRKSSRQKIDLSHLNVLVADDDAVNRMVIGGQLKTLKISADFASSGGEAIEKVVSSLDPEVSSKPYDLVFMDCQMPELDGFATTRKIRVLEAEKKAYRSYKPAIYTSIKCDVV